MADRNGYIGRAPGDSTVQIARQKWTASGVTTNFTFTSGYTPGLIDVYLNGSKLIDVEDYAASGGGVISLGTPAADGDVVEAVAYKAFNLGLVNQTTGDFTVGGNLSVTGNIVNPSGIGTDYIITGYAATFNNTTNIKTLNVSGVSTFAGKANFSGDVAIGGTLTYEDVTNIDSVGLITARAGVIVVGGGVSIAAGGLNVTAGVATFTGNIDANGNLDVDGHTDLDNVNVAGAITATTFSGNATGLSATASVNSSGVGTFGSLGGYNDSVAGIGSTFAQIYNVKVITKTADHRYYGTGESVGYTLDGIESPFITLTPGRTYRFLQNDSSNNSHAIIFYLEAARNTEYTGGVTYYADGVKTTSAAYDSAFNAASARWTEIFVQDSSPQVLYYQCYNHGYMGNAVSCNSNTVYTGIGNTVMLNGFLKEKVNIVNGKLSENLQINLDDGMIHHFRVQESATSTPNIMSNVGINTVMNVGDTLSVSLATSSHSSAYSAHITIDGTAVTEFWNGGPPSGGNSAGRDLYTYNITKMDDAQFIVYGNVNNYTSS